ncbi:hypothetical protein BT96DRAFT_1002291 [Gymnopus androsaceus JB14]|uniref:Uncharacterized protein n=1 Tax=Gymnopus androsaceus JB14 TaxID=1447944 RepID=A0A6A4GY90_9AGAR|nr:hypothetical protein BT96DRAFT_1002291 [Gymnopus androsaceus JB14]
MFELKVGSSARPPTTAPIVAFSSAILPTGPARTSDAPLTPTNPNTAASANRASPPPTSASSTMASSRNEAREVHEGDRDHERHISLPRTSLFSSGLPLPPRRSVGGGGIPIPASLLLSSADPRYVPRASEPGRCPPPTSAGGLVHMSPTTYPVPLAPPGSSSYSGSTASVPSAPRRPPKYPPPPHIPPTSHSAHGWHGYMHIAMMQGLGGNPRDQLRIMIFLLLLHMRNIGGLLVAITILSYGGPRSSPKGSGGCGGVYRGDRRDVRGIRDPRDKGR